MRLLERFWVSVTYAVSFLTLSPFENPGIEQQGPLTISTDSAGYKRGPIFKPPGGQLRGPGSNFSCDYSQMLGWVNCSTPINRGCWLKNDRSGAEYNINTNYEDTNQTPVGIHRTYYLNITDSSYNADGQDFSLAKMFNNTYPGPWIQGCWGDNITVVVTNKMKYNGTSVHWHGIRQWLTMHMDGVNGITQCPIAPESTFNYTFRAMQYGSSWYHSHYSVQYADGAIGPLTLHGPSSANYDVPTDLPLLMTDWGHNSAFEAIWPGVGLKNESILLNGIGNVTRYNNNITNSLTIPAPYSVNFATRGKRYLLRLINTSFDSTFVFSIDNHMLQIIGADFVPVTPYKNTSVLVGIGQRYHVIVEAIPVSNGSVRPPTDDTYWIRTWKADCFRFNNSAIPPKVSPGYEKTGILRYGGSQDVPRSINWPLKTNISLDCSDETYESLKPILKWKVGNPANDPLNTNLTVQVKGGQNHIFPLALFSIAGDDFTPLHIDYANPIFLKLNYTSKWDPLWCVIPENYTATDWVYLVIKGKKLGQGGAHPIHLHGHDFAILQQIGNATFPDKLNLTFDNPPRRDVVLLPDNGYVVIAFKTDNPGSWLLHCHIADHASFGLALQILERQNAAADIWPNLNQSNALRTANTLCHDWTKWWGDCNNWWPGAGKGCQIGEADFSPDSGI